MPLGDIHARVTEAFDWFEQTVLNLDNGVQIVLIAAALAPALIFGPRLRRLVAQATSGFLKTGLPRRLINAASMLMTPLALLLVLTLIQILLAALDRPYAIVNASTSLMTAWIVIRAVSLVIQSKFWSKVAFYIAWPIAVLDVFGLLVPVIQQMQTLAVPLGVADDGSPVQLSLLDIFRTLIYFAALFWLASLAGRTINGQLEKNRGAVARFQGDHLQSAGRGSAGHRAADRVADDRVQPGHFGDLLRRGGHRGRSGPAEDRVELRRRFHPAGGQIHQARRRHRGGRHVRLGHRHAVALCVGAHP